jgi:acyl dehydratase
MEDIYFEDVTVGDTLYAGPYVIPEQELVAFAATWDPLPIHVDKAYAASRGGLTAPGIYLLAVKLRLVHTMPFQNTVIASVGYDQVRFLKTAHPGDALTLALKWTEKRLSRSKPDRGIVAGLYSLLDVAGETVMSNLDTVLMRVRNAEA